MTGEEVAEGRLMPTALTAMTLKTYAVPLVRPVTTIGLDEPEAVNPPGLEVTVYEVIDAPPVDAGAVNATEACALLAVATALVGAPGATDATVNDSVTCEAAEVVALPAWSALIVQVPAATNVSRPPLEIVQTPVVADVKAIIKAELDVAVSVGVVPKLFVPGLANEINCEPIGVVDPDDADALPVPALLVAVTVKV